MNQEKTTETEVAPAAEEKATDTKVETAEKKDEGVKTLADAAEEEAPEPEGEKTEDAPALPDSADKYELTIPEDIGLKDEKGDPFQFDPNDPLAGEFKKFAFDKKLSQEAVNELVGLYAKAMKENLDVSTNAQNQQQTERINAELEALKFKDSAGKEVTGGVRVDRLLKSLDAALGDGASKDFAPGITSAAIVKRLETLVQKANETAAKGDEGDATENLRGEALIKHLRSGG